MPRFFHERPDARELLKTLAAEKGLPEAVIEKDYWVMHCVWGLQQNGLHFEMKGGTSLSKGWGVIERFSEDIDIRFDPPPGLSLKGEGEASIKARFAFFDNLAAHIKVPGVAAERNPAFDDERGQNGGISLKYESHFAPLPGLKPEVVLEAGFARTTPNEPRDFTSWIYERARAVGLPLIDNRAPGVKCFNPEYTFVDKLQTICRRFRQHRSRRYSGQDRPREFLRHYYDLYKLLEVERVLQFIGTLDYDAYKEEKLRGGDSMEFVSGTAFTLADAGTYTLFEVEFASMRTLLLGPAPTFDQVMERIRKFAPKF